MQKLEEKRLAFCEQRFTDGPAFKTREWSRPLASNRHFVAAYTCHGFHHLICKDPEFYAIGQDCTCHICEHFLRENRKVPCHGMPGHPPKL